MNKKVAAQASESLTQALRAQNRMRRESLRSHGGPLEKVAQRNCLSPELTLEFLSPRELRRPERRVRKDSEAHIAEVVQAISSHGFCVPVLVGKEDQVLDGLIRLEAAMRLGL